MAQTLNLNIKKEELKTSTKTVFVPFIIFAAMLVVFYFSVKFGYDQLQKQRSQVNKLKKEVTTLREKDRILKSIQGEVNIDMGILNLALPEENPSLTIMTQLKNVAGLDGVILENLKVSSSSESKEFSMVTVGFEVAGTKETVYKFFTDLKNISPIVTVERASVTNKPDLVSVSTRVQGYYAPYPNKLPALTDPIKDLTTDERKLSQNISQFTVLPNITIDAFSDVTRTDPF